MSISRLDSLSNAVKALQLGGVIAYPTEYCFGLGCDPQNIKAIEKLLKIKQRQKEQGVILIAANIEQVTDYAKLDVIPNFDSIKESWPGPNTWILPAQESVSNWVKGRHSSIAMRISAYDFCQQLCDEFGGAIVSTSANRHGQASKLDAHSVKLEFGDAVDYVCDIPIQFESSADTPKASTIRDAMTGEILR